MRIATFVISGLEAAMVAYWIIANRSTIGSTHQFWYFEIPFFFMLLPASAIVIAIKIGCGGEDWRLVTHLFLVGVLILNLLGFFIYGALSGGGV